MEGLVFYRCQLCRGVVSPWDVKSGSACTNCGHRRISPTNLTLMEKIKQVFKHPKVWRWDDMADNNPATEDP